MRQVPAGSDTPLGIVGDGRVARHFRQYLQLLGRPVRSWARRSATAAPDDALRECDTVLLLIDDRAITPFVRTWPALADKRLVHCSGALVTAVAEVAHPLMTFGEELYDLDTYRRVPFVLDEGGTPFSVLLPGLPNPSFTIRRADRPLYHALCVLAGNYSTMLWEKLFRELELRFGIPAGAAFPYLARIATNLQQDPFHALTGPLGRGDADTVRANRAALEGDPFLPVYAAFEEAYAHRA